MDQLLSVTNAAELLGISRTAVLKRIKNGSIRAQKVGNSYLILKDDLTVVAEREASENQKAEIDKAVSKTIKEYGETLRMLKEA